MGVEALEIPNQYCRLQADLEVIRGLARTMLNG